MIPLPLLAILAVIIGALSLAAGYVPHRDDDDEEMIVAAEDDADLDAMEPEAPAQAP